MCDYRTESKKKLDSFQNSVDSIGKILDPRAYKALTRAIHEGRAMPGKDLYSGKSLPSTEMSIGHYMNPDSFQKELVKMDRNPYRCAWCGGALPQNLVSQHLQPHNHREYISHHHHPQCWDARLLAIAIVFGHISPERFFVRRNGNHRRRGVPMELNRVIVKKVYTRRSKPGKKKGWRW